VKKAPQKSSKDQKEPKKFQKLNIAKIILNLFQTFTSIFILNHVAPRYINNIYPQLSPSTNVKK